MENSWKSLSTTKKIVIGLAITIAAMLLPEIMLLIDIGGIEFAFGFLFYYSKPIFIWIKSKKLLVMQEIKICHGILLKTAFCQPKIFMFNSIFCCVIALLTSSFVVSLVFYIPALSINI